MENLFNKWIDELSEYEDSNLTSIATYTNGLAMQKFRPKDNDNSLQVVKIKEMNNGISQDTERCALDIKDEVKVYDGDILFAWSGTLCMTIWCNGIAGLNQHIFKVTSDKYPKWFYYFWTLKHLNKFKMIAAGKTTTMGHIQRKELDNSEVKIPTIQELERMDNIMKPLLEKYIINNVSNRTLNQLRDILLPKLMNGEIDLDNIEI
jgi:type I restriction enzyme S subunit